MLYLTLFAWAKVTSIPFQASRSISVDLRHAVINGLRLDDESGEYRLADVFFREDPNLQKLTPPFRAEVLKACFVEVSLGGHRSISIKLLNPHEPVPRGVASGHGHI